MLKYSGGDRPSTNLRTQPVDQVAAATALRFVVRLPGAVCRTAFRRGVRGTWPSREASA